MFAVLFYQFNISHKIWTILPYNYSIFYIINFPTCYILIVMILKIFKNKTLYIWIFFFMLVTRHISISPFIIGIISISITIISWKFIITRRIHNITIGTFLLVWKKRILHQIIIYLLSALFYQIKFLIKSLKDRLRRQMNSPFFIRISPIGPNFFRRCRNPISLRPSLLFIN